MLVYKNRWHYEKYEILLLDLDDTLIDNTENVKYAFKKMVEFLGQKFSEEGFIKWMNLDNKFWTDFHAGKIKVPSIYQKPQELFVQYVRSLRYKMYFENNIGIEEAFKINNLFLESLNEVVVPIEGAYETLNYLYQRYQLVIATNGPTSAVNSKLGKIDCLKFVTSVFSVDMTRKTDTKPNRQYFEELKEFLQFYDASKMLIIGDSLQSEVLGGMNSNIDSCWFNRNNKELPNEYNSKMVIHELRELTRKL